MSNTDPLVLIERASDGYRLEVPRSHLTDHFIALGFTEVRRVYADDDSDAAAWDAGVKYIIQHADGTRYATTYDNWFHRYHTLGYTIVRAELGGSIPESAVWDDAAAWDDAANWGVTE